MAENDRLDSGQGAPSASARPDTATEIFIVRRLRLLIGRFLQEQTHGNARAVVRMLELAVRASPSTSGGIDREDFLRLLCHWRRLAMATSRC